MQEMRVDTDILRSAAERLDAVRAELEGATTAGVLERSTAYGSGVLQAAARAFHDSWAEGLRLAAQAPEELATGVRENARTYDEIDARVADSLRQLQGYDPVRLAEPLE